jgi:outer membrane protein assembly factor BamB
MRDFELRASGIIIVGAVGTQNDQQSSGSGRENVEKTMSGILSIRWQAGVVFSSLVVFQICASMLHGAVEEQWSRFRGPNGSGLAQTGPLPAEFGPEKNLIWRTELPAGHSSPVVDSERVFLTAVADEDLITICLDKATGKEIWRQVAPRERRETLDPRNNPASPSPVVDGSSVFVFFPDFGLLSYSRDGQLQWKKELGPFSNIYGMGASPIVVDDLVVLVCDQNVDSYIIALDKTTGEQRWKTARPEATSGHCSPIVYRPAADADARIIAVGSFYLTAYSARTGEKLWWVGGLCFEMKSTPVIGGGMVFINGYGSPQNEVGSDIRIADFENVVAAQDADGDQLLSLAEMPDELAKGFFPAIDLDQSGSLNRNEWKYFQASIATKNSLMAIRLGGNGDMTQQNTAWKYFRNIPQLPSPLWHDNFLWMISDQGIVTSFNATTGEMLKRGRLPDASGSVYASPVLADGKLFFVTVDGKVVTSRADGEFEVLAVNDLGERCYATPAFDHDRIYIRTEKALHAFGNPADEPLK